MRRETARRRSGARGGGGFRRPSHDGAGGLQGRSHELGVVFLVVLLHGPASARAPMCVFSLLGPQPSELLEGPLLQFYSLTFRRLLFPDGPPATVAGFREAATREGAGGQPVATPQRAGAPKDPGPVGVGCLLEPRGGPSGCTAGGCRARSLDASTPELSTVLRYRRLADMVEA